MLRMEPVAYVANGESERKDEDWGNVESVIELLDRYDGALLGLGGSSHAIIITYLHQAKFSAAAHLQRRPRNLESMPMLGIFAQRGKSRPNPLGVTAVEIVSVGDSDLVVRGLDAIDGTPVLDIKPYFPHFDRIDRPSVPDWVDRLMEGYF